MSDKCQICGRNRVGASSGSLTQWIATCICDLESVNIDQAASLKICQTCGKRVLIGRSGSFTQWIFRHDCCGCETPTLLRLDAGGRASEVSSVQVRPDADEVSRVLGALSEAASSTGPKTDDKNSRWVMAPSVDGKTFPVDRFKPIYKLGSGNHGDVHLCLDLNLNKLVCVKTLQEINKDTLVLFQREAKAMSRLRHPNIVSILDFGITNGIAPYMVSEYFDGDSLEQLLQASGAIRWTHALAIGMEVAKALAYAHRNMILHGDIKPSNILIAETGKGQIDVRVIDFGLAQVLSQTLTGLEKSTKSPIGTPTYMSPDQARGLKYEARSEVYSLGCVLFECICGRPPFRGSSPLQVLSLHAQTAVPTFVSCGVQTPLEVETLVMKCLTKDPADRTRSMQALGESIEGILRHWGEGPGPSPPTGNDSGEPYLVPRRRRKSLVNTAIIVLVLFLGGVVVLGLLNRLEISSTRERRAAPIVVPGSSHDVRDSRVAEEAQEKLLGTGSVSPSAANDAFQTYDALMHGVQESGRISLTDAPDPDHNIDGFLDSDAHTLAIWSNLWTDRGMEKLVKMRKLQTISVGKSGITDQGLQYISTLPDIRELVLLGTTVTDKGIGFLHPFSKLRKLVLSQTQITDAGVKSISEHNTQIEELRLEGTSITDIALNYIQRLPKLRILDVKDCKGLTPQAKALYREQQPEVDFID